MSFLHLAYHTPLTAATKLLVCRDLNIVSGWDGASSELCRWDNVIMKVGLILPEPGIQFELYDMGQFMHPNDLVAVLLVKKDTYIGY